MLGQQVAQAIARRGIELDRTMAPRRPDPLQHHLGRLEVALARPLDGVAHQLLGDVDAEAVEVAGDGADRVARPSGAAGIAPGEAAVGLAALEGRRI